RNRGRSSDRPRLPASRRARHHSRPVLVFAESRLDHVFLRMDARHAAAPALRPTDVLRLEISVASVARKSGDHGAGKSLAAAGEPRMTLPFIVFFVCAFLAVLGALTLILAREPIHSALALILVMAALAVLYLLLGAEFIAAVQMIVYAGAIMVLFVFVIMLLNAGIEERTDFSKLAKYAGLPLGMFLILFLGHWMAHSFIGQQIDNGAGGTNASVSTRELSAQLFQKYL